LTSCFFTTIEEEKQEALQILDKSGFLDVVRASLILLRHGLAFPLQQPVRKKKGAAK
jgi:hypothetical protein